MGLSQSFYNKVYFVLYLSWIVGNLADNNVFLLLVFYDHRRIPKFVLGAL